MPAVRYARGITGLGAAIALVLAVVGQDFRIAVFGIPLMLVLMVALFAFERLKVKSDPWLQIASVLLLYGSVILGLGVPVLLCTSAFFNWPVRLKTVVFRDEPKPEETTMCEITCNNGSGKIACPKDMGCFAYCDGDWPKTGCGRR